MSTSFWENVGRNEEVLKEKIVPRRKKKQVDLEFYNWKTFFENDLGFSKSERSNDDQECPRHLLCSKTTSNQDYLQFMKTSVNENEWWMHTSFQKCKSSSSLSWKNTMAMITCILPRCGNKWIFFSEWPNT